MKFKYTTEGLEAFAQEFITDITEDVNEIARKTDLHVAIRSHLRKWLKDHGYTHDEKTLHQQLQIWLDAKEATTNANQL